MSAAGGRDTVWTVPNAICGGRIAGLAPLLWTAHAGHRWWFFGIMVTLMVSDWLDGKLAVLLDQKTEFGAVLDSSADALMYGSIIVSFWWIDGAVILEHVEWFGVMIGTWGVSVAAALGRFGKLPSYHAWGAKVSWLAAALVAVVWLLFDYPDPLPWLLGLVSAANLEAAAIGLILPEWRVNVPTAWHALQIRRDERRC